MHFGMNCLKEAANVEKNVNNIN